jgi:hypothetical protein
MDWRCRDDVRPEPARGIQLNTQSGAEANRSCAVRARCAGKVFGGFQSSLDECLADDYLGSDVGQFTSLPRLYLLSHRLEVALHSIDTDLDAVDEWRTTSSVSRARE